MDNNQTTQTPEDQPESTLASQTQSQPVTATPTSRPAVKIPELILGVANIIAGVMLLIFIFTGNDTGRFFALLSVIVLSGLTLLRVKKQNRK